MEFMQLSKLREDYLPDPMVVSENIDKNYDYKRLLSWDEVVNSFIQNEFHKRIVDALRNELTDNGSFRQPVKLSPGDADEGTPAIVENGTHRVVASILENVDKIPVSYSYEDVDTFYCSYFSLENPQNISYDAFVDKFFDLIEDNLSSFRLDDQNWMTAGTWGSNKNGDKTEIHILWDNEHPSTDFPLQKLDEYILSVFENSEFGMCPDLHTDVEDFSESEE